MNTNSKPHYRQLKNPLLFLAYGGGCGLVPKMPGTIGSLLAIPLYYGLFAIAPPSVLVGIAAGMFVIGIPLCSYANRTTQTHDSRAIVWDEVVGFFIVLLYTPHSWQWLCAAFICFRFFDAVKPFPISWLDKNLRGGFGVMADDLVAATATIIVIAVSQRLFAL